MSDSRPTLFPTLTPALSWSAALAMGALILYPLAISLPVLEIRKLGHTNEVTVWSGAVSLITDGQVAVGLLVFCCSIIIPFLKLSGILLVSTERPWRGQPTARRHTHAAVTAKLEDRRAARAAKDFKKVDQIRDELAVMGFAIKDVAGGKVEVRRA